MRLWKISYVSTATAPDEIGAEDAMVIAALAEQHNAHHNITGILTLHTGRFAQVLEGPETALRALMARIIADPRHHSLRVIADGPLDKRRYPDWSMSFRDAKQFVLDQIESVLEQTAAMTKAMRVTLH